MKRSISYLSPVLIAAISVAAVCPILSAQVLPKNKAVANQVAPVAAAPAVTVSPQSVVPVHPVVPVVVAPAGQNIQATRAADLGLWFSGMANNGLTISDLADNSIFTHAGFRVSDQILSINGQPIKTEAQLVQSLTSPTLGTQPVQTVIVRNGQQHVLTMMPTAINQGIVTHDPLYQSGLVMDDTNPNQIVVQRVYPRTPAYYAGLRQGDVITTFGGQRVTSLNAFKQGLSQANVAVPLQITRAGQTRDLQLAPVGVVENSVRTALRPNIDASAAGSVPIDASPGATSTAIPASGSTVITPPTAVLPPATLPPAGVPASPTVTPAVPPTTAVTPATPTAPTVVPPAIPATPVPAPIPSTPR